MHLLTRPAALLVFLACLVWAYSPARAEGPASSSILVVVEGLENTKGSIQCGVWKAREGFPNTGNFSRRVVSLSKAGPASCRFDALPAGTYAIAIFHDENGNGRMDKGLFGVPKEGYGVSNNRTYAMAPPKWEESKLSLKEGEKKRITITLRN